MNHHQSPQVERKKEEEEKVNMFQTPITCPVGCCDESLLAFIVAIKRNKTSKKTRVLIYTVRLSPAKKQTNKQNKTKQNKTKNPRNKNCAIFTQNGQDDKENTMDKYLGRRCHFTVRSCPRF